MAKGGAVQATRGRRGRRRQRRCCCCCGGGRHGLGLPRRRHHPGGARTLLDSGTHLGLGLGLWMRVGGAVSCFVLWAAYYGYTHRCYSLWLLTAYRGGGFEAGGSELCEEGVQRGVCLRERGRIGEDHCAPSKKKEKVSK